jgi:excisionase family DNA binding protein
MKRLTIEDVKNTEYWMGGGESFYTMGEVAEILKITKPTIKNYIKKGKIKGEKIFGKWCVSENNLRKYLGLWYTEE